MSDIEERELRAENERQRMQLVACSVIAMSNTPESLAKNREMHPGYDCISVQDVIQAVEREIKLRAQLADAKETLGRYDYKCDRCSHGASLHYPNCHSYTGFGSDVCICPKYDNQAAECLKRIDR